MRLKRDLIAAGYVGENTGLTRLIVYCRNDLTGSFLSASSSADIVESHAINSDARVVMVRREPSEISSPYSRRQLATCRNVASILTSQPLYSRWNQS